MKIICHMNMPTPQQESFYRELAKYCDLTVVYQGNISDERKALGWDIQPGGYAHTFAIDPMTDSSPSRPDFRFLTGLPGSMNTILHTLRATNEARCGVQAEMRSPDINTVRRRLQSRMFAVLLRAKDTPMFGIGSRMREYLRGLNVLPTRIYPFAYFSPESSATGGQWLGPVLYIGELAWRKGIDVLLKGFSRSTLAKKRGLIIAGSGPQRKALEKLAVELEIASLVKFVGPIRHAEVMSLMADASAVVLPSRFDGWGFVINEAISVGVPVIVSDQCGVQEVVRVQSCGHVVSIEDSRQLGDSLESMLESKEVWDEFSARARVAHRTISASTGTKYFLGLVEHIRSGYQGEKPVAPWLESPTGVL